MPEPLTKILYECCYSRSAYPTRRSVFIEALRYLDPLYNFPEKIAIDAVLLNAIEGDLYSGFWSVKVYV